MDNLTHSLVGFAVAKTALYWWPNQKKKNQLIAPPIYFVVLSMVAASFPDFDVLLQLYSPTKLNYLITHRGHTHSLWALIPQGLVILGSFTLFLKYKNLALTKSLNLLAGFLVFINLLLHLSLDFLNNYGIHPFSPWNNKWYYGDMLHIIEPLLWLALMPFVLRQITGRTFKYILPLCFLVVVFTFVKLEFMSWINAGLVIFMFLALAAAHRFLSPKKSLLFSWVFTFLLVTTFYTYKLWSVHKVNDYFYKTQGFVPNEIVLSALPSSPFCWEVMAITLTKKNYRVDHGNLSHFNFRCQSFKSKSGLSLNKSQLIQQKGLIWQGEYQVEIQDLMSEYSASCKLRHWFQFARVPVKIAGQYSDYRYSLKSKEDISAFKVINGDTNCPKIKTHWTPPRQDLINYFLTMNKEN